MLPASGELGGGSCNEVTTELTAKGVDDADDDTDDEDTDDVWQGMMMTSRIMVRTMDNGQVSYDYGQWLIQNQKERFIWAVDDINLMLLL